MPDLLLIRDSFVYEAPKQGWIVKLYPSLGILFRRHSGDANARCSDYSTRVQYRALRGLRALCDSLALRPCAGIGNTVPLSDREPWAQKRSKLFAILSRIDQLISNPAIFRVITEPLLLRLEQIEEEAG